MPNLAATEDPVSVALLYQTSQLEGHLKDALKELGAAVVYEALTADMDRDALEGSGAHVVIVNLDPEIESHLDEVYDLLDDARYNVVFNDAQVSVALSGWDQARWSRHLAAKIMGRPEVSDPPRPKGSQAPPSPAQKTARAIPDAVRSAVSVDYVPDTAIAALYPADGDIGKALDALLTHADDTKGPLTLSPRQADPGEIRRAEFEIPALNLDFNSDPDAFAAEIAPSSKRVPAPRAPSLPADFGAELDSLLGDIPTATIAGADDRRGPAATSKPVSAFSAELDALALDADRMVDSAGADAESPSKDRVSAIFDGFENEGSQDTSSNFDFGTDLDALFEPNAAAPKSRETAASPAEFDLDLDSMFAEPVATSNRSSAPTLELPSPFRDNVMEPGTVSVDVDDIPTAQVQKVSGKNALSDLPDFDADFAGLFESIDQPAGPGATSTDVKSATGSLSDWSLDALEDAVPSSDSLDSAAKSIPNAANRFAVEKVASQDFLSGGNWSLEDLTDGEPAKPAAPDSFGVEKVAAQDFLAPEGGDPKGFDFNSLPELDLVPLEDAVAPQINRPELVSEHRLDDAVVAPKAGGIRNVVVLGASIGGPEAVREFLAAIPARFPALFVLAQHMGAEFLDLMAAQLAKATKLTVRTPSHGERLSHGEVIVVPTTHRLLIDADGVVQLAQLPESSPYSPSIDLVLRDIADRFAATTTAIIFSGMAHDAIDGSKYLASKGGKVWVQDPDTCVISSMVDGAREAGVVTFIGAPAQLAQQTIASYAKA